MLLSAVSVLVVAQSSSEIPEGLMNNPVIGSIVQYMCTVKDKLIVENPLQCDSLIYLLNLQIAENYTKNI